MAAELFDSKITRHHAGLCTAMPEMVSLGHKRHKDSGMLLVKYVPKTKTIHPKQVPMFDCRGLRSLDLR